MSAIGPISGTSSLSPIGPLPAGVKPPSTPQQQALYDSCKQFEGVFVKQLVSGWMKSARGDDAPEGAQGIYQDMADDTMTSSLVDGGTFGLAGTMYSQLVTQLQAGAATPPLVPPAAPATPTDPTAGAPSTDPTAGAPSTDPTAGTLPTDTPTEPSDPTSLLPDDPTAGGETA
jgi:Rod binding domain-containing protein